MTRLAETPLLRDSKLLESEGRSSQGRLISFPARRETARPVVHRIDSLIAERITALEPRERFFRALEMESRGFIDGAIAALRGLFREGAGDDDPRLAISMHYFLASFLMLKGELTEACSLAEEGVILAWEHDAREELELLENLSRQLEA